MNFLHTADWHMSSRLGREDLTGDILASLRQIAAYLEAKNVDVMTVAGDLLESKTDEGTRDSLRQLREIFGPFLARGGQIVAVAGNHDSELKFEQLQNALALSSGGPNSPLFLTSRPELLTRTGSDGQKVQFVLLPYPFATRYLDPSQKYESLAEKNRLVMAEFEQALARFRAQCDPQFPTILVSHIHIRGANVHSLYRVSESDDVVFDAGAIPLNWVYGAYGHIHKPAPALAGAEHIRYCGSIVRLDAAEKSDVKSCVFFRIENNARVGEIEVLPLQCPQIHELTAHFSDPGTDPRAVLEALKIAQGVKSTDLVKLRLQISPHQTQSVRELRRAAHLIFPRLYAIVEEKIGASIGQAPAVLEIAKTQSVSEVVREFLGRNLSDNAEREAILQKAEMLLAQES